MATTPDHSHAAELLMKQVSDLLDSTDPRTRVRAVHMLSAGVERLERHVVVDAQESGLSWAQIGDVYGVSRQAVHRRFADSSYVSSHAFDDLLDELESEPEAVPALERATARARGRNEA
ncbi:MAG: hypothetical protein R3320_05670 [Nitriliruptorales bacterium]|nr:hypothetical protein [Nitriliruptorales bacterium]